MTGVELIAEERKRQLTELGHTAEADDSVHAIGDLAMAGACYAACMMASPEHVGRAPMVWPWEEFYWKPSPNQLRNLAKAGALIAAEMDRLMRMDEQPRTDE